MKFTILILVLSYSFLAQANDSIIQLLEQNQINTDEFIEAGQAKKLAPNDLQASIRLMLKKKILTEYATADHDSDQGQCYEKAIVKMFSNPDDFDPITQGHCGGIIESSVDDNDDRDQHSLQHSTNIIWVKQLAYESCNKLSEIAQMPVFTAPQHLVDIIYGNSTNHQLSYHLSDATVVFHCIKPQPVRSSH